MELTLEQAAEKLDVHASILRVLLERGSIPGRRVHGEWRVVEADLKAYKRRLGASGPRGPGPPPPEPPLLSLI